jgi:CheY-like chemotaxis protein
MLSMNRWASEDSLDPSKRAYFRISEVAQVFGLTVQTIHFWLKTGRIRRYQRTSNKGNYMIPRAEFVRLLREADLESPGLWEKSRVRVLLIDDDRSIRELAQEAARSHHQPLELITAVTVEDGLLLASEFMPDIILLDYFLTKDGLRGDQALAFIRKAKRIRALRVIAVANNRRIAARMLNAGANSVLLKPFDLGEFREAIFAQAAIGRQPVGKGTPIPRKWKASRPSSGSSVRPALDHIEVSS